MSKHISGFTLTRRELLRRSTVGAAALGAGLIFPEVAAASPLLETQVPPPAGHGNIYAKLLQTWCDGLLAHQVTAIQDPALHGCLLCPACGIVHGRCGDAVYPLLRVAHTTGQEKYLKAAVAVHDWTERTVSRADGSWINDLTLSTWKGITVFHSIALAEALHHHGELLDAATRQKWTDRLARAAKFLDGFISIETGNINYPITASYCFALCGVVLKDAHYTERARKLANEGIEYFTPNGFLYGEGHPIKELSAKGCRPVDLGYNVEESLPALALYSLLTGDKRVLDQTVAALRTHMEFMLPDGGWDNSWGTRNYKWSWWGSRTSDGCHPAYALLAEHEPKFKEVAYRNVELMAACTHEGLLYGGPDYFAHGDKPCIHHTFTHAKALATVLDRGGSAAEAGERVKLPRDEAYGLKTFPEIGTRVVSVGEWRGTVTENDWEYVEHVQAGGGGAGGGHASGGALSLLYHQRLGPVLVASMTEYQMVEISNQQGFTDAPHMTLTPRIESVDERTCTSLSDKAAEVTAKGTIAQVDFDVRGRLLTSSHQAPAKGEQTYHLAYRFTPTAVEIVAKASGAPLRFILPVVSRTGETISQPDGKTVRIAKKGGTLTVHTDAPHGFENVPEERTFNLVPGFECVPLIVAMVAGEEIRVRLEV